MILFPFFCILQLLTVWHSVVANDDELASTSSIPCGNVHFSFELLGKIVQQDENLVASPASLQFVMAMLARGTVGTTNRQILDNVLLFRSEDCNLGQRDIMALRNYITSLTNFSRSEQNEKFQMKFANYLGVKGDVAVKEQLEGVLQNLFNFRILRGDARELVQLANDLVANDTNQLIQDLLPADAMDDPFVSMVVINALYLKASWFNSFHALPDDSNSEYRKFNRGACGIGNNEQNVDMMQKTAWFLHYDDDKLKAIKIPFTKPRDAENHFTLYMYIVVPKGCRSPKQMLGEVDEMSAVKNLLRPGVMTDRYYRLIMPQFNMSTSVDNLHTVLENMGVTDIFSPRANFTRMFADANTRSYALSKVAQKCVIKVRKEGVEAAAATYAISLGRSGGSSRVPELFVVNRPFLFFITARHPNQKGPVAQIYETVLFAGQYVKPDNN